jgi:hypothetical protein
MGLSLARPALAALRRPERADARKTLRPMHFFDEQIAADPALRVEVVEAPVE